MKMIKKGDNVILKFSTMWDGEICRDHGKAYIYPSMDRAVQFCHPDHEELVEYTPVKYGRWINRPSNSNQVYCSECAMILDGMANVFNYCPNCGADMRGENNGK